MLTLAQQSSTAVETAHSEALQAEASATQTRKQFNQVKQNFQALENAQNIIFAQRVRIASAECNLALLERMGSYQLEDRPRYTPALCVLMCRGFWCEDASNSAADFP